MSRSARVARAVAVLALALSFVVARVVISARAELREGEALLAAGDADGALDRLGRAARLDAPGNPYSARALVRIAALATAAESRGAAEDRAAALAAWREARSAVLATRSVIPRHEALRARADARIAALSAALESPSVDPDSDEAARVRWHAARLAADDAPSPGWSLAAIAALIVWLGCALGLFTRGLDERLRWRRVPALLWSTGVVLGFALFLVALARA